MTNPNPETADRELWDRIAATATPYFMNFSDEDAAKANAGELADAVLAVLPPAAVRARVLHDAADAIDAETARLKADRVLEPDKFRPCRDASAHLRRLAAEQPTNTETEAPAEDPARIDRIRPEFTEHASIESIDAQLRRARAQERRWHLRTEWLTGLRQARVEQKGRGERPAVVEQPDTQETRRCTCARSWNLHSQDCAKYRPGHDLAAEDPQP